MSDLATNKHGRRESMDSTPMTLPAGFRRPPSLIDQMRVMIRREMSEAAAARGRETFEEANDFEVPDEPLDPSTPWEHAADGHDDIGAELQAADLARAARRAGFTPPTRDPVRDWALENGWEPPPPKPSSPPPGGRAADRPDQPPADLAGPAASQR